MAKIRTNFRTIVCDLKIYDQYLLLFRVTWSQSYDF
jgi:hypothetical protein